MAVIRALFAAAAVAAPIRLACGLSSAGPDLASLLQKPHDALARAESEARPAKTEPLLIGLRRESVPIYRRGKIASFKTSYSGVLSVGTPAQEFRVVFDTGSGNIVLPAAECKSEACLVEDRRRFNMSASRTSAAINSDGSDVPEGEMCDQVTIGFGTGEITGEFTRDQVCFGLPPGQEPAPPVKAVRKSLLLGGSVRRRWALPKKWARAKHAARNVTALPQNLTEKMVLFDGSDKARASDSPARGTLCVEMSVVLAVEMSTQPFKTFRFDGILGLGLSGLAMNNNFSAFQMLLGTGLPHSHFGVFLTEGEDGEESEIAMGGHDSRRLLEPLSWAPVAMADLGYWQVHIVAVRINGKTLDVCRDGTCRGVVDTGTSHLGVPAPYDAEFADLLTQDAGDLLDCRLVAAPEIEIELPGYNLTLHPFNYMRRLPLREGVSVSSAQGVFVPSSETNATLNAPSSADAVVSQVPGGPAPSTEANTTSAVAVGAGPRPEGANTSAAAVGGAGAEEEGEGAVRRHCRPRLMPVRLPEPLGPKLFILGEPVLHRYYTVYDWANHRVGFGLANNRRNTMDPAELAGQRGVLPKEVDMLLMQQRIALREGSGRQAGLRDEAVFVQVQVMITVRTRRL